MQPQHQQHSPMWALHDRGYLLAAGIADILLPADLQRCIMFGAIDMLLVVPVSYIAPQQSCAMLRQREEAVLCV